MNNPAFSLPEFSLEDIDAKLAEKRLYDFTKASWPILHPQIALVQSWHLEAICLHLEAVAKGQINNLLITVAPRMTKSVIASINFPAWVWGPNNDPSFSFMYTSFAIHLASDHSTKCRTLIESDWYQRYWGHRFRLNSDQNEKLKFANNRGGVRAAFGMGGVAGQGAKCVVCDDPSDTRDWTSPTRLKSTVETFDSSIYNRVNNPTDPRRIIIMQRISDKDLAAHVLRQGNWEHLSIPTEYDPKRSTLTSIGWKDPRKIAGELACPARYSRKEVEADKKARPRIYNAQHQQNPAADEGAIFPRNKWRYYKEDPKEIVRHMEVVILSMDAAFKDKEDSSKVAIHIWGKRGANKFLLDRETEHMDFNRSIETVRRMSLRWPQAKAKIIESKANGDAIINYLHNEIPGMIGWPPPGERMDSKVARAWAVQPEHEAGNLWLPDPQMVPWVDEMVETCAAFPEGEFDDDIDALSQAIQKLDRTPGAAPPQGIGLNPRWLGM
jgi:predicted phage terminase large subunit-like protein